MRAKSLIEIYKIFDGQKFLTEKEDEYFVPAYTNILKKFQLDLILNEVPSKTFFIAGQTGNGKSTALNFMFIKNQELREKFYVKNLEAKDLFQYNEVDIIDILITIGIVLIEEDEELEKEFLSELRKLRDKNLGLIEETEIDSDKNGGGYSASVLTSMKVSLLSLFETKAELKARFFSENETRKQVKKVFNTDKSKIIEFLNNIITKINQKNQPKKLLLIIDGLERKDNIAHIFTDELYVFDKLECEKIITIPVYLATERSFVDKKILNFNLKIEKNPFSLDENTQHQTNVNNLREIIRKRIDDTTLITDEAIEKAVEFSGGNIRQLIRIVHESALTALTNENDKINIHEIESVIQELQSQFSQSLVGRIDALDYIKENNIPLDDKSQAFKESIKDNMVFAYFNGTVWYDLNPVIKKTVELYKRKIHNESTPNS